MPPARLGRWFPGGWRIAPKRQAFARPLGLYNGVNWISVPVFLISGPEIPFPGEEDRRSEARCNGGARSRSILRQTQRDDMYKLITILVALIPIILFLKTLFFGRSQAMKQASSELRRQIDYLVWVILFLIACGVAY